MLPERALAPVLATVLAATLMSQSLQLDIAVMPGSVEARIANALPGSLVALVFGNDTGPWSDGQTDVLPEYVAGISLADAQGLGFVEVHFPVSAGAGFRFVGQAVALDPALPLEDPEALRLSSIRHLQIPERDAEATIIVLFGQSNAEGEGDTADLPAHLRGPLPDRRTWNELYSAWQPLTAGVNNTTTYQPGWCGAEMTLTEDLKSQLGTGGAVYLVKFAVPATALGPTEGLDWGVESHELYDELQRRLANACQALRGVGLSPRVRGICMMQGENDAYYRGLAGGYRDRLRTLVQRFRADLVTARLAEDAAVPFVIGLLDRDLTRAGFPSIEIVRQAQIDVAATEPRCATVETTGLPLMQDRVHFATAGLMALGRSLAAALQRLGMHR